MASPMNSGNHWMKCAMIAKADQLTKRSVSVQLHSGYCVVRISVDETASTAPANHSVVSRLIIIIICSAHPGL
jgi:hypothetical protein